MKSLDKSSVVPYFFQGSQQTFFVGFAIVINAISFFEANKKR